jgi:hypothetical protein
MVQSPSGVTTELVKVDRQSLEASLFEVPAGYTKTELPTMNYETAPKQREEVEAMMKQMREKMKAQQGR